jgi:hypothetical protein
MAKDDTAQSTSQNTASTVALENLTESIARATLRALDERQLANATSHANLPIGDGHTVLGILIPCDRFGALGLGGEEPCNCHVVMGIIIIHPPHIKPLDPLGGTGGRKAT